MLRKILVLTCVCYLIERAKSARRVDAHLRAQETMALRREAISKRRDVPELDTRELLALTEGESMVELRKANDVHGTQLNRLQEEYNGIPVYDSVVTVRTDNRGQLTGDATGTLVQDIGDDLPNTKSYLTDDQTLFIAIEAEGDSFNNETISRVSFKRFVFLDRYDRACLVNRVSYTVEGIKKPVYIIDVKEGTVLKHWDSLMKASTCNKPNKADQVYGGNELIGKIKYGTPPYCLDFTVDENGNCFLENKYVKVIDLKQTNDTSLNETAYFQCNQVYNDSVNGAFSPVIDVFHHATTIGKMFEEWYNTTVLREKMVAHVHYGSNFADAQWHERFAVFGDGDGIEFHPFTSMDVVGHEFGHGVIEQGSNLEYLEESGAINEAFADIMGETAEDYFASCDFKVGSDYTSPYREFQKPERDGYSISNVAQFEACMDVHYSSGLYRRVWYILIKKYKMKSREAFQVFLFANSMYWHYLSTFYDASCGLLKSAMDLGIDTKPFARAFKSVGIQPCNISSHVVTLEVDVTQEGITVSRHIAPVFGFIIPIALFDEMVIKGFNIDAFSPPNRDVPIAVYSRPTEEGEIDENNLVTSGAGILEYNIPDPEMYHEDVFLFIKLGPTDCEFYDDVQVTADVF